MKHFVGEFGDEISPIAILYDSRNVEYNRLLIGSLFQVFGPFLDLQLVEVNSAKSSSRARKILNGVRVVICTTNKIEDFIDRENKDCNQIYLAILDRDYFPNEPAANEVLSFFDRVLTFRESSFEYFSSLVDSNKLRKVNIALDLRRFYNLKANALDSKIKTFGVLLTSDSVIDFIESLEKLGLFLTQNHNTQFIVQPKNLSLDFYNLLKASIPRVWKKQIIITDPVYSLWQQLEFFKSIDVLVESSNTLSSYIEGIQAQASNIPVLKWAEVFLLDNSNDYLTSRDFSSDISSHDFRLQKFSYIKHFFDGFQSSRQEKSLVVVPADAGFFSVFNTFISIKAHWTGVHGFTEILPDWSARSVLDFWKTDNLTSFCYAGENEGNVFHKLFNLQSNREHESAVDQPVEYSDSSNPDLGSPTYLAHSPNLYADPDLTYVFADRLYRSAGFSNWRYEMNKALGGLQPRSAIISDIDNLFTAVGDGDLVIGMHVRHPSHASEQPDGRIPLAEDFIRVAKDLIIEKSSDYKKVHVLLATDQEVVVDQFREVFTENLLVFGNVTRVSKIESENYEHLPPDKKLEIGSQVQHLAAKNRQKWGSHLAEEVIRDAWALARSGILVHAVSNVATAVTFINPNLESLPIRKGDDLSTIRKRKFLQGLTSII